VQLYAQGLETDGRVHVIAQEQLAGFQVGVQKRIKGLFQQGDTKRLDPFGPCLDGAFEISGEWHIALPSFLTLFVVFPVRPGLDDVALLTLLCPAGK